jgi:hypothetical protein
MIEEPRKSTKTERLVKALLADREREAKVPVGFFDHCFACGVIMGKYRDGRFCSARCRGAYDNGAPAYGRGETQTRIIYKTRSGEPMRPTASGFLIQCANCNKEFDSKGLRCCSIECERGLGEKRKNLEIMAEVGIDPAEKRRCLQCGGIIPKWTKGKKTPSTKRFCSDKCSARHRRQNPPNVAEHD